MVSELMVLSERKGNMKPEMREYAKELFKAVIGAAYFRPEGIEVKDFKAVAQACFNAAQAFEEVREENTDD